jgi:hypothetical protein
VLAGGGKEYTYKIDSDPRFWFENTITTLATTIDLPSDLAAGEYNLYLNLPDGYASLAENPLYSIRLMNTKMWDEKKGYNLLHTFSVQ